MNNDNTADIRTTIAARIHELRKQNGFTQRELAERSGVSRRTIQAIEAGDTHPRIGALTSILEALDHTLEITPKKE
jgi:transcriptional regulator with XRE-family HTH domain